MKSRGSSRRVARLDSGVNNASGLSNPSTVTFNNAGSRDRRISFVRLDYQERTGEWVTNIAELRGRVSQHSKAHKIMNGCRMSVECTDSKQTITITGAPTINQRRTVIRVHPSYFYTRIPGQVFHATK